jgi:hypothetical protein
MIPISSILVADGSSDRMLIPVIQNALKELYPAVAFSDIVFSAAKGHTLGERIAKTIEQYSCDLLFVHRDAEKQPPYKRLEEIELAVGGKFRQKTIAIVPVRMTEAWLLCDEDAIRCAVGNENGVSELALPAIAKIESCEAKNVLDAALTAAVDHNARRRRKFYPQDYRYRVAELCTSRDKLLRLASYKSFEDRLKFVVKALVWKL